VGLPGWHLVVTQYFSIQWSGIGNAKALVIQCDVKESDGDESSPVSRVKAPDSRPGLDSGIEGVFSAKCDWTSYPFLTIVRGTYQKEIN
jgi:hypothetical protein